MSEDKLRTLLAEARHVECGTVDRCSMCERIDAALAEPVVWCARCEVLEQALRASCGPGCSHEGESHEPQRSIDYHAGWAALGDDKCGYCGKQHDAALAEPVEESSPEGARFGCGDNSCTFKALSPGGMGTNGGCRCFKDLESWIDSEKRWNRPEVRRVEQAARMLSQRVHKAEKERDEARAEVERLKLTQTDWYNEGFDAGKGEKKEWSDASFRRGAEAMREAAASEVAGWASRIDRDPPLAFVAAEVRALPVPEDKP